MSKLSKAERAARARAALFGQETKDDAERSVRDDTPVNVPIPTPRRAGAKTRVRDKVSPAPSGASEPASVERPAVSAKQGLTSAGVPYPAFEGEVRETNRSKRYKEGDLKVGDSVWYRGERYWIEFLSNGFYTNMYARISDRPSRPGIPTPDGASSFCVHLDLLDLAPQVKNIYAGAPTMAAEERKERAKQGIHDVGDEVATLLRACKTLEDVYKVGAKFLELQVSDLRAKYQHLNNGQQRMNIGNRMRAKWKKEQRLK